jgi:pyrimidine operon attenuation protein/uracil phosphoribosyltransferase
MKEMMNKDQLTRTLKRMTHEIIERNTHLNELVLVGILKKGYPIAQILRDNIFQFADTLVPIYGLDINPYRDDLKDKPTITQQDLMIDDKIVILVDDVLFTGRSVRAAMDALLDHGRPRQIELAILIDRGHRELPIRADFIGKNIPTSKQEKVLVDVHQMTVSIEEIKG